jgi:hypothetical protein
VSARRTCVWSTLSKMGDLQFLRDVLIDNRAECLMSLHSFVGSLPTRELGTVCSRLSLRISSLVQDDEFVAWLCQHACEQCPGTVSAILCTPDVRSPSTDTRNSRSNTPFVSGRHEVTAIGVEAEPARRVHSLPATLQVALEYLTLQVIRRHASSEERVRAWYDQFNVRGMPHFRPASKALADFSLAHRERYWHLLSWRHRSRAPTTVAHKLGYFSELLVVECVSHFLEECPEFWHSDGLRRACSSSLWIQTGVDFFAQVCCSHNAAVGSVLEVE